MDESHQAAAPPAASRSWLWIAALASAACILLSAFLEFLSIGSATDSQTPEMARFFGAIGQFIAPLPLISSFSVLLLLLLRSAWLRGVTAILLRVSLCGISLLIILGVLVTLEAQQSGGDWAALGFIVSIVFGIILPLLLIALCLLMLTSLKRLIIVPSPQIDQKT